MPIKPETPTTSLQLNNSSRLRSESATKPLRFSNPGTVSFSPAGTFVLSATASSGLPVSFGSRNNGVCSVQDGNSPEPVTIHSSGICQMVGIVSANANYNAAIQEDDIVINPANQTIDFLNPGAQTYVANGTQISA